MTRRLVDLLDELQSFDYIESSNLFKIQNQFRSYNTSNHREVILAFVISKIFGVLANRMEDHQHDPASNYNEICNSAKNILNNTGSIDFDSKLADLIHYVWLPQRQN